ncbi:MAG TPA: DUF5977 domain-containing protein [Chitinophagaceae bacterium]
MYQQSLPGRQAASLFVLLFTACITVSAQVNLQTGSATFSLPMFTWQDHQSRLNAVVTLSYHSGSGLKVNEVASNAGQGWSLIAGGVITRLQVGEPDDQQAYGLVDEWDTHKYPNGYLYAEVPAAEGCPTALTRYPIYKARNQVYAQHNEVAEDKQLDYFSFQFNGKAGLFVLDGSTNQGVSLGDSKLKISFVRDLTLATGTSTGIRTTITSFTIQDVDGTRYKFSRHGLSKVLRYGFSDESGNYLHVQPDIKDGRKYYQAGFDKVTKNPWVIDSWYLSEIEDALTLRKVTLSYVTRNIIARAGEDISFNDEEKKDYCIITYRTSITQTPEISSIAYPDGHSVNFAYASTPRADFNGQYALSSVDIKYQGRYLSRYKLTTSYFIGNRYGTPKSPFQKKLARLCLKSVQKIGVDLKEETPPYLFDYYTGSSAADDVVPPLFSYAKDAWGFYNGSNSKGYESSEDIPLNMPLATLTLSQLKGLCFLRRGPNGEILPAYYTSKSGYAKNGLLRQVIYPTGGTLTYTYGQNNGHLEWAARTVGGVHVTQTASTDGGYSNPCDKPITTSYNYVLADGSASSLWGLEVPKNSMVSQNHYQPAEKYYHWTWSSMPLGECAWRYQYPGILSQQQAISLPGWINTMNSLAPVLGILNVLSTIKDIVTVCTGGSPVALVIDVVLSLVQIGITCIGDQAKDRTMMVYYSTNLHSGNPLPAQFKRVEIVENPGTIGKTVQVFTSDEDYSYWESENLIYSAKQRFAPWAYGLPKLITILDAAGNRVKETEHVYGFGELVQTPGCSYHPGPNMCPSMLKVPLLLTSFKCAVNKSTSQKVSDWRNIPSGSGAYQKASGNGMDVDKYDLYTGRLELKYTLERIYKPTDQQQYVESRTEYEYNPLNYQVQKMTTFSSDGTVHYKRIKYSVDFSSGVLATLNQNNIVEAPVVTQNSIFKSSGGTTDYILGESVTEYSLVSTGDIRPYQTLEQRFKEPLPEKQYDPALGQTVYLFKPYQGPGHPNNATSYVQTKLLSYDVTGNLSSLKDEGGRRVSHIYGYGGKYVTATAINAGPQEIFFDGFEEVGGWNGTTAPQYGDAPISAVDNARARTGVSSARIDKPTSGKKYSHSDQTLRISLTGTTKFKMSAWIYSNGPSADVYLFMKRPTESFYYTYVDYMTTSVTGQWVYVEKEFSVPAEITQLNIRLDNNGGGSVWFDDVRLHPSKALMTSYTYDPLLGKTSESDANSRATFYEYDNLGRLKFIKDDKKNAVKMYEYNNVSRQNGCPGIYYNRMITETFTKDNCGAGFVGSDVPFIVTANTYSSAISQADADAQAENYLLVQGQLHANTFGSCIQVYYNDPQSRIFTTENCGEGYKGGTVTYTVPASRYSSIVSKQEANQQALDEIEANGDAFANDPANVVCVLDTAAHYVGEPGGPSYCANINGQLPAHLFVWATDVNPNSPSYGQSLWLDADVSDLCPSGLYYNEAQSGTFTRNNCPSGSTGTPVTYTVPPGKYSSTVSVPAANQLALNEISANGQAYANDPANGGYCIPGNIYARMDREITYWYYDDYYTYETADFYVRLYSNSGGTVPYTLQAPLTINARYTQQQQDWTGYYNWFESDWTFPIDPGNSEYWVDWEEVTNCYQDPDGWSWSCTYVDLYLLPGNGYTNIN